MQNDVVSYFLELIAIDSESKNERAIADKLKKDLKELGAIVEEDDCGAKIDGNAGNLYAYFPGVTNKKPILLCAHCDTVVPGKGIKPTIENGRIFTDGTTVLGGDDKSGIAEILMAIKQIKDKGIAHPPIEVLITVSEEIGLLGAKNFDISKLQAAFGYALDTHQVGEIVIGAPSQNSFQINFYGKEAHAGVEPEKGLNAICIAAEAIMAMPQGRIDFETTCNTGIVKGGSATNIVPKEVLVKGEARSHNKGKLQKVCEEIEQAVISTVKKYGGKASFHFELKKEYEAFLIERNAPVVALAEKALQNLHLPADIKVGGGGSDANIFNANGLPTIIVGTGMNKVHTTDEDILVDELYRGTAFVEELIRLYAEE
ncbi:MAG TPA: M20/M25/M40 family metallo-hydrolase [Candidatus Cloacimonas sp.]|nr:M20/M25/M40 family metallo-hydrolase [Candidatus Cloacimonas sp.]